MTEGRKEDAALPLVAEPPTDFKRGRRRQGVELQQSLSAVSALGLGGLPSEVGDAGYRRLHRHRLWEQV